MKAYVSSVVLIVGVLIPNLVQCIPKSGDISEKELPAANTLETPESKQIDSETTDKSAGESSSDGATETEAKEVDNTILKEETHRQDDTLGGVTPTAEPNLRCPGITCSALPKDASCEISTTVTINPLLPLMGSNSDCCPVHVCSRKDGTKFVHYGIQSEGFIGFGPSSQLSQRPAGLNNFPTPAPFLAVFPAVNYGPQFQQQLPVGQGQFFDNGFRPQQQQRPFNFFNGRQPIPQIPQQQQQQSFNFFNGRLPVPQITQQQQQQQQFNPFFGNGLNGNQFLNRNNLPVNRNVPFIQQAASGPQFSSWELAFNNNRDRRDLIPQQIPFARPGPMEFGPQFQQGVFPFRV